MEQYKNNILLYRNCGLAILILLSSIVHAQTPFNIEGRAGIEFSSLEWAVAGNIEGNSPNVLSELRWTNLSAANYQILASFKAGKINYFFHSSLSPNITGQVQDIDYAEDDRVSPIYNEVFSSTAGNKFRTEMGIKTQLKNILQISTGIRYRNQRLFLNQESGRIRSYYNSRWTGVFLGFDKEVRLHESIAMSLYLDADLSRYYGYGNWKLRNELLHPKSFVHQALSYGFNGAVKTNLQLNKRIGLHAILEGNYTDSFHGKDILYFQDGYSTSTQLNGVKSLMFSSSFGISTTF